MTKQREIKFRQPITKNGIFVGWHYWGYIGNNPGVFTAPLVSNDGDIKRSYQYTGLKDKNNEEIYEGDIINYKFKTSDEVDSEILHRGDIFFDEYMWCVNREDGDIHSINRINSPEIIGNIYEK